MPANTLNILVDQRFEQSPDGRCWTHLPPAYPFFERTLGVFDEVRVIARVRPVPAPSPRARRVDGPRVSVLPVPCYTGLGEYLRRQGSIRRELSRLAALDGAFLLRVPSQIGFLLASQLEAIGKPYAVELLTDPWDFFAPGVAPSRLALLCRPYMCARSRHLCAKAQVVNYVTGSYTRNQNPPRNAVWSGSVSDVELEADAFCDFAPLAAADPLEIVTVGFLDLLYKGQDILIEALGQLQRQGLLGSSAKPAFRLTFVGDGERRPALLAAAARLGIGSQVEITGLLGGSAEVRQYLQRAHLFVLPSRAEGIPRALIEAMAASRPAIGTSVGAMPDLLDPHWIVSPANAPALAAKILEFSAARRDWHSIGRRNQSVARSFEIGQLAPRRTDMYLALQRQLNPRPAGTMSVPEVFHAA